MKIKRIFAVLTLIFAVLGFFAGCEDPNDNNEISFKQAGDFIYIVNNQTITIVSYTGTESDITIPAKIDGKPVTAIGDGAFSVRQLTSITIPNSVTYIGLGEMGAKNIKT